MKLIGSMIVLSCSLLSSSSHADTTLLTPAINIQNKINLNTASAKDLLHIVKGIGEKRALAIIQYRQKHGKFRNITDLAAIKGIGLRFVQSHRAELDEKLTC